MLLHNESKINKYKKINNNTNKKYSVISSLGLTLSSTILFSESHFKKQLYCFYEVERIHREESHILREIKNKYKFKARKKINNRK